MTSKEPDNQQGESRRPDTGPLNPEDASEKESDLKKTLSSAGFDLKKSEALLVDREWLSSKTQEELIELIFQLFLELKTRVDLETRQISSPTFPSPFPRVKGAEIKEFIRRPAGSKKAPEEVAHVTWRLVLTGLRSDHKTRPIGLEIFEDIVIGRTVVDGAEVDLDLTNYDGSNLGVSRRHALLRPRPDHLELIDLGSTNGTLCNAVKLRPGVPLKLGDGDTISFGGLHFNLRIVAHPSKKD